MKRIFLIVLDSFGIGALPDAAAYGDAGANTLATVARSAEFRCPTMLSLGLGNIDGVTLPGAAAQPGASFGRLAELSTGKDTTIGHWELAGVVSERPLPVYPHGFPRALVEEFERQIGVGTLCNQPYSGTQAIHDYGREHIRTGKPILYTSADSVFQLAAHEKYFGLDRLYRCCETARALLTGEHGVGRVIARPFVGEWPNFTRTANRHDYSIPAPRSTLLDCLSAAERDVIAVGKISDIFCGRGVTRTVKTRGNADGMAQAAALLREDFYGLCFINLVDFDSLYGHRNDRDGYARALSEFDAWLRDALPLLGEDDALLITADHGCDPGHAGTDHTREYVPLLACGKRIRAGVNLGTLPGLGCVGRTAAQLLGVDCALAGESFAPAICKEAL